MIIVIMILIIIVVLLIITIVVVVVVVVVVTIGRFSNLPIWTPPSDDPRARLPRSHAPELAVRLG